jgi:hypothetical protein
MGSTAFVVSRVGSGQPLQIEPTVRDADGSRQRGATVAYTWMNEELGRPLVLGRNLV